LIINNNQIKIFPNPSTRIFNIKIEDENIDQPRIRVFNLLGQEVFNKKYQNFASTEVLNLSDLVNGTYILQLEYSNKKFTEKIILLKE